MEAFAVISIVSSIVQLVDFGASCLSSGLQLYRSTDGVSDEHEAIGIATQHLAVLNTQVRTADWSHTDQALQNLCNQITSTTTELLGALKKVKVTGKKTKFKCMRKAIQSVWSGEKIEGMERMLNGYKAELNLHISVEIRKGIQDAQTLITARLDQCTERTREIFDAVIHDRDVFETTTRDQTVLLQVSMIAIRERIGESQVAVQVEVRNAAEGIELANQAEHVDTRQMLLDEGDRITASLEATAQLDADQHEETRLKIAELQGDLMNVMKLWQAKEQHLQDVLRQILEATSEKKRKVLQADGNAITETLVALAEVYRQILAKLDSLKATAADWARISGAWTAARYAQLSQSIGPRIEMMTPEDSHVAVYKVDPFEAHGVYYGEQVKTSYVWMETHSSLVDPLTIRQKWPIQATQRTIEDGRYNVDSNYRALWLLSMVNAAILRNFTATTASLDLMAETFVNVLPANAARYGRTDDTPMSSTGDMTRQPSATLKRHLQYLTKFAELRGMLNIRPDTPMTDQPAHARPWDMGSLTSLERRHLLDLLAWLIGPQPLDWSQRSQCVHIAQAGPARAIIDNLMRMGVQAFISTDEDGFTPPQIVVQSKEILQQFGSLLEMSANQMAAGGRSRRSSEMSFTAMHILNRSAPSRHRSVGSR